MPSKSVLAMALVTGMALATAACGSRAASTTAGSGSPSSRPASTGSASSNAASPTANGACGGSAKSVPPDSTLTLGSRDNRATFCVRVGQLVIVYLNGSPAHMWAPIHSDSSDLKPTANGHLMLRLGVTGAAFIAARPGIAHITSARPVCTKGPVRCDAMIAFQVTVVIAGNAS
ncbi:MAG TPA: hypothetical protein VII22_14760 [Streptosporangiaceae bacterium]